MSYNSRLCIGKVTVVSIERDVCRTRPEMISTNRAKSKMPPSGVACYIFFNTCTKAAVFKYTSKASSTDVTTDNILR